MSETQSFDVSKLEKLRASWLPAIEFLFGETVAEADFEGFEIRADKQMPCAVYENETNPLSYKIQIPEKSLSNDVMLLADVLHEMCHGLYPIGSAKAPTVLAEGVAIYGAITGLKQVFGEECIGSYLDALREQAFQYYDAFSYVAVLLTEDPQAIKKLREIKPFLNDIKKADFEPAGIDIDVKVKDILTITFRA